MSSSIDNNNNGGAQEHQQSSSADPTAGRPARRRKRGPRGGSTRKEPTGTDEQDRETQMPMKTKQSTPKRDRARTKKSSASNKGEQNLKQDDEITTKLQFPGTSRLEDTAGKSKKKRSRKRNIKSLKYPWRRHVPPGAMDPITLDPLVSLNYPPFAVAATEPYAPVPEWPVPEPDRQDGKHASTTSGNMLTEEQRQKLILKEQWGLAHPNAKLEEEEEAAEAEVDSAKQPAKRHYNLFDGRALAYYLVSQLQFIDPFNRRDLTRAELVNLDAYLNRHGFANLKVVEAYDAKGVTISRSGAVGATAAGRASILQQEAQVLLNALFGAGHQRPASSQNELQQQYEATQTGQQSTRRRSQHRTEIDSGVYGDDEGGMLVIDDDANPGLRGSDFHLAAASLGNGNVNAPSSVAPNTFWSASHITSQYSYDAAVQARNFPALPTSATVPSESGTSTPSDTAPSGASKAPSRSLAKITKVVSRTDPEEAKRQKQARDEMQRRAMLTNLWLTESGGIPSTASPLSGQVVAGGHALSPANGPSEAQLRRNEALATALGVAPATVRQSFNKGWSRPTDGTIQIDEFGNELNAAKYPDSLIIQARDRTEQLLKLEKKWKAFLLDDQSASLPLRPMDRPLRAFVHEYSDYWRLHTESFDREPKRYIHCVKLKDTSAPVPLLSDVARHWRGPSLATLPREPRETEVVSSLQTAGETSQSREFPPPPDREPLRLKPRSIVPVEPPAGAMFEMPDEAVAPGADESSKDEKQLSNRFDNLFSGRERPKITVAPRTKPRELPPFEPPKMYNVAEERGRQQAEAAERARKERQNAEKRRNILMQAFASSDEEELGSAGGSSSEWEDMEAQYSGSDSEKG